MAFVAYGGKFEQKINELYSLANIKDTASKFKDYEQKHGTYVFGQDYTKFIVPKQDDWADKSGSTDGYSRWEKASGEIPESIRNKITEVISANLRSDTPLPLVLKVGENVDGSHDLIVRMFAHNGHLHIGLHMLCPNSSLT
jgi:hypothetical protein